MRLLLWLRARRLTQLLWVAVVLAIFNMLIGSRLSPVPAQMFYEVHGLPMIYFSPLVFAVSIAMSELPGKYWFESSRSIVRYTASLALAFVIAFLIPIGLSSQSKDGFGSIRNGLLLAVIVLALRIVFSAVAAASIIVIANFTTWTFGWDSSTEPHDWAWLLLPASAWPPLIAIALSIGAIPLLRQLALRRDHWP